MKAQIKTEPAEFKPIEMTITFESIRELQLMRMLMNESGNNLAELANIGKLYKVATGIEFAELTTPIYNEVKNILKQLNNG